MTARNLPIDNPAWLLAGKPAGFRRQNLGAFQADANLSPLTSGVMLSVALPLQQGDLVTNLTFVSATTAAATLTNWWFALYDDATTPALISQTADQTSTAWGSNTAKTLALGTPYVAPRSGVFYAAVMVAATTVPTLLGHSMGFAAASSPVLSSKTLAQTSGSSLTTTAPSTITSATAVASNPLVIAT